VIINAQPLLDRLWGRLERKDARRLAKRKRLANWHPWFAWRPGFIAHDGKWLFVWLSTIARRNIAGIGQKPHWEYGHITSLLK
jgi:hypothetical protein